MTSSLPTEGRWTTSLSAAREPGLMPAVEMSSEVQLLLHPKGDWNLLGRGEGTGEMETELRLGWRWEERDANSTAFL